MISNTFQYKSESHPLHTEDALAIGSFRKDWQIGAVMDGCSSGIESQFISGLYVKLFRKTLKSLNNIKYLNSELIFSKITAEAIGEIILKQLFADFKSITNNLALSIEESLSTLILAVYNPLNKEAYINVSGDGFFSVNNNIVEIDQNNIPDFMGYHLKKDFEQWFKNHTKSFNYTDADTITIATDGISKFRYKNGLVPDLNDAEFFLDTHSKLTLQEKFEYLTIKKKLLALDDLAIVEFKST